MSKRYFVCAGFLLAALTCGAVTAGANPDTGGVFRLWDGFAPGSSTKESADIPTLTIFRPPPGMSNGAMMVICPGGNYANLSESEGKPAAKWMASMGVTAFVLQYRLAPTYRYPVQLEDAKRAVRLVRTRSGEWNADPRRVGVMGFGVGGHLAAMLATHSDSGQPDAPDPVDRASCRPDSLVLVSPIVSMSEPFAQAVVRDNLLGKDLTTALLDDLSSDKHVTAAAPPCFIVEPISSPDTPAGNCELFAAACRRVGVPVVLRSLSESSGEIIASIDDAKVTGWTSMCSKWLTRRGFLKKSDK